MLKIANVNQMNKSSQDNQQKEPKQCKPEVEYVSTKTWKVTVTASISGNK